MDKITERMSELYKCAKAHLQEMVECSHRVVDLQGVNKDVLVSMLLEAEFGRAKLSAWNQK